VRQLAIVFTFLLFAAALPLHAEEIRLEGDFVQGGLVLGTTQPNSSVSLDGRALRLSVDGVFVFGFGRDARPHATLHIIKPNGSEALRMLAIAKRDYDIQRIDGLPPKLVTPPEEILQRIREEVTQVRTARAFDMAESFFKETFIWPAEGQISGVYGSQRILNGEPRQPHFGIDIAAPVGTPVVAPAGGEVRLAEPDLYFSGGTIILDHGHGVSSSFLHMSRIDVTEGQRVKQGEVIGAVGATGRVTGAHLDWRMNWFERRVDPALLIKPKN